VALQRCQDSTDSDNVTAGKGYSKSFNAFLPPNPAISLACFIDSETDAFPDCSKQEEENEYRGHSLQWTITPTNSAVSNNLKLSLFSPAMSHAMTSSSSSPDVPPFDGFVETTVHALRLIQAARQGVIPRITRRLNDAERRTMVHSGAVFVFSVEESGIKRWTDGLLWSPSRIVGNFLVGPPLAFLHDVQSF
jgi:hypothetical protein